MSHTPQRYLFIDLLRFIAVFFMIQGHVFEALLDHAVRLQSFYYIHDFFHGFVAPIFLFASGTAFGVSTFKRWEEHTVIGPRFWKRVGKFLGLLVIGYALHLPYFSLAKIIQTATPAEINSWLQSDALHCIAVTLLCLQIGVLIIKNERRFVVLCAVGALFVIFFSPIIWSLHLSGTVPMWLVSYLNNENASIFPLFPWSAYMLCGVLFGSVFINAKEHHHAVSLMQKNVALSAGVIVISLLCVMLPIQLYPAHDFWKTDPAIFFVRLGAVSMAASSIFFAEHSVKIPSRIPVIMGRESLFIYVVHLMIVYGSVVNPGLKSYFGPTLSVVQAIGIFLAIFFVMAIVAYAWYEIKARYATGAVAIRIALSTIFLYEFLTRPW